MTRSVIETVINGRHVSIADAPADTMALSWLRSQRLISVKEGCGEGDCGACTVALGTPGPHGFIWRAVNSCLLFLPMLDGRAILTVEGLTGPDGAPHPVQQAMAERFATQCGFCSPGFAMSLFAYAHQKDRSAETALDAIAGNLCRCTGYRPIVETARSLPLLATDPAEREQAERLVERTRVPLLYRTGGVDFFAPTDLGEALAFRATHPKAWVLAGGTDLGLFVNKRDQHPESVLSLARVDELGVIAEVPGGLSIGAAAPYVRAMEALAPRHPGLATYMRRIGATQVRNQGTLGGNLGTASPIGDSTPALIALDASVELASPRGRRRLLVDEFVTGYRTTALAPDEVIAAILVPDLTPGHEFHAYKVARRVDQDISAVSASFVLELEGGRVAFIRAAFGGVAGRPVRARQAEAALQGQPWTEASVASAKQALASDIAPRDDFRGSAAYRAEVAANLIERLWYETSATGSFPSRLEAL